MFPELFELPFIGVAVKSYGLMMVTGFLLAVFVMRRLSRMVRQDPDHITNVALYALISGVIGARIFYVIHHHDQFVGDFASVFAVWQGGLEFLGGVVLAIAVVLVYLVRNKLRLWLSFDMLAIGLMIGLSFGRVGCFLNGCCFGKPTNVCWAVRFPYGSPSYISQSRPDPARNRFTPQIDLPAEYFGIYAPDGHTWIPATEENKYFRYLKPRELLTPDQKQAVGNKYKALPVHPTQLYSSIDAMMICVVLLFFWRRFGMTHPGTTISLMFILYGPMRFLEEMIRDDNPYEHLWWVLHDGWTVSQNLGIYLAIVWSVIFVLRIRKKVPLPQEQS
jgi:phosphatidylglycerol:prolipoprotein diacylglycerol transferase